MDNDKYKDCVTRQTIFAPDRLEHYPIINSYRVGESDSRLFAGEYPGTYPGDKDDEKGIYKLKCLVCFGITHIIDLTEEGVMRPYSQWLPKGVVYRRFPIADVSVPVDTVSVMKLLDDVEDILANDKHKVYIHCYGGVGRTGTIVGCWIGRQCRDYDAALSMLRTYFNQCPKAVNRVTPETEEQKRFIKRFIANYNQREEKKGKFQACLLGGAVGDALGYAVEFTDWQSIQEKYGKKGIRRYQLNNQGMAEISDDTQMTLFTANGILFGETRYAMRGIAASLDNYVKTAYLEWLQTQTGERDLNEKWHSCWLRDVPAMNHRRAPGMTCMSALINLKQHQEVCNHSKGCGGVMRVAPVGLFYARIPSASPEHQKMLIDEMMEETGKIAGCTHKHPLGYLPAAVLAYIIYRLVLLPPKEAGDKLETIIEASIDQLQHSFIKEGNAIKSLRTLINMAVCLSKTDAPDETCIRRIGDGWVGDEALAIAVYCCCKYRKDFEKAVCAAVNHSGDSDSTGAICGNIMGAMLGLASIPDYYLENLELKQIIQEIASDLFNGCCISEYDMGHTVAQKRWEDKYIYAIRKDNYDDFMPKEDDLSGIVFRAKKICFFDEDIKKMEGMSADEKIEFKRKLKQEQRYVVIDEDNEE